MADGTRDLIPSEEADGASSRAALFRFDPGWPFVIAGLALIVSAVLIPAQRELHDLEQKLAVHHAHEERAKAEILAYEQFNAEIEQGDERLLERLVRAQLNRMPKDERPLLLMPSANDTVPMWIESSVAVQIPEPTPYPDTLLSRIATGPRRLWVLATGAFLVFVGVMFAPSVVAPRGLRRRTAPVPQPVIMEPVVMEPVVTDPVAAASSADTVAATTAGSVVVGAGTLDVETDAAEAESPEAESPEADAFQPQAIECELDDGARFGAEVVESESTEADCTSAETLDSALGTVAIFEAQDVHELQYAESPVHLGCEGSERDGVADDEVADDEVADDEVAGDEVAGNDVAGDEGSGNDLADDEVADDGGEEIARAETVAMSEDPSDASSAEVVVEPPLMEIETFPPPSFGSTSAERTADPLSLFSGIADDRWIDTRAR